MFRIYFNPSAIKVTRRDSGFCVSYRYSDPQGFWRHYWHVSQQYKQANVAALAFSRNFQSMSGCFVIQGNMTVQASAGLQINMAQLAKWFANRMTACGSKRRCFMCDVECTCSNYLVLGSRGIASLRPRHAASRSSHTRADTGWEQMLEQTAPAIEVTVVQFKYLSLLMKIPYTTPKLCRHQLQIPPTTITKLIFRHHSYLLNTIPFFYVFIILYHLSHQQHIDWWIV